MIEHDCDTDEDCEVYFLKPVNEYNIVEKIKEANKELFDEGVPTDPPPEKKRKVQFRPNLEEYEPISAKDNDGEDSCYEEELNLDEDSVLPSERTISAIEECAEMLAHEVQKKIEAIEIKMTESDEEVEEICEEIIVMDMDTGRKLDEDTKEINSGPQADYVGLTLKSKDVNTTDKVISNNDNNEAPEVEDQEKDEQNEEDDEDDKLSIIVASYLPPDTSTCENETSEKRTQSFSRHFSLRRKNTSRRMNSHSPPDITNLKLNYKTCCEYRNSEGGKLPKYTGYMSEYGLSRDQLDKREQTLQKKHNVIVEKNLKATEAEVSKMQDNERAFTTWLKNKMRFPINRTKNMFDLKKASGSGTSGRSSIIKQKF